jgi:hypothetical protein
MTINPSVTTGSAETQPGVATPATGGSTVLPHNCRISTATS